MDDIYQICVLHRNRDFFDYRAKDITPYIGARVWVPFRNQICVGIVISKQPTKLRAEKLKTIAKLIDVEPLISPDILSLCHWISKYYQSPLSEVLALALPKKLRLGQPAKLPLQDFYHLKISHSEAKKLISLKAIKQRQLIDFLDLHKIASSKILKAQGFNTAQINALLSAQIIELTKQVIIPENLETNKTLPLTLNSEQMIAVTTILDNLHHYRSFLLYGVTGSGKTEVYLQIIAKVLEQGKQALILVPEIGLTPQLLTRFARRFNFPMAIIHSNLNDSERQIAWQLAKEGRASIIIGTRSAVFTPMPNLGLIIIDEEHDSSFKQAEGVRYSARDCALMRAHLLNLPIVLGSATPSLESLYNCKQNKYTLLKLSHKALNTTPLYFQLVDLRTNPVQHGLASSVLNLIREHLNNKNQVLIFINRRGFAPVLFCTQCSWISDCKACDSHMIFHKQLNQMICHHCGATKIKPTMCLACKSSELIPLGVGTQRIHEFLNIYFPHVSIIRMDKDELRNKNSINDYFNKIKQQEAQLIIGTQMMAKGHHFPQLSLVVILEVDSGLYSHDFRGIEHFGQLLTQVAGRVGRAKQKGHVVIQTYLPQHPLLNLLIQQGYDKFAEELLYTRQQAKLPPFQFLAVIRAQSKISERLLIFLQKIKQQLTTETLIILGPAPAPLAKKAYQYRMQLLVKSDSRKLLNCALNKLRQWLAENIKLSNSVRWSIDVDPIDLF